jgi:hypothetical protein
MDISMELFGLADGLSEENSRAFHVAFSESSAMLVKRAILSNSYWLADSLSFRKACRVCHALVDQQAKPVWLQAQKLKAQIESKQDATTRRTLLDELVAGSNTYAELRSKILGLILASYETTAALMCWTFYFLAHHPGGYAKLREEVLGSFGNTEETLRNITFKNLQSCTYLQHCMKESLRLEPPVPRATKTAARDVLLPTGGGPDGKLPLFVPKVHVISVSLSIVSADTYYRAQKCSTMHVRCIATSHIGARTRLSGDPSVGRPLGPRQATSLSTLVQGKAATSSRCM